MFGEGIYLIFFFNIQNYKMYNHVYIVSLFLLCREHFVKQIKANFINILSCLKSNEQCLDI